jgi:hypothetical protein
MSPHTVHRIAQEIRNERANLTALEKWARTLDVSQARIDTFHYINFRRKCLLFAEREIESGRINAPAG